MLIGGLWHGAGWTFVVWGALHGLFLAINHLWRGSTMGRRFANSGGLLYRVFCHVVTILAVVFAWVVFRAETFPAAVAIIVGMIGLNGLVLPEQVVNFLPMLRGFIDSAGTMPLLAGGSLVGLIEMVGLYTLLGCLLFCPNTAQMSNRLRLGAIVLTGYFSIQAVIFGREASEFLYFQF